MTALALRTSAYVNGVSALHGEVTRAMWRPMWPDTPADQVPVRSITNGVHVPTWMAGPVFELLDRHFGPGWLDHVDDPAFWDRLNDIPDEEIWAMRQALRDELFIVHPRAHALALVAASTSARAASSPAARCSIPRR